MYWLNDPEHWQVGEDWCLEMGWGNEFSSNTNLCFLSLFLLGFHF